MNLATYSEQVYTRGLFAGLKPDERLTVSEWADEHRHLSSVSSPEPGPWRTQRVPYTKEIMDALSVTHPARYVTIIKGSQIAGSEIGNNFIGYVIDEAPGPMMYVLPNERMAERASKTRVQPMIEESERLRKRVRSPRTRDSGNTVLTKEFPGGVLVFVGANAPSNLRMMPIKYLILDEPDEYKSNVGNQGDPVELAIARTRNFSRKKIYVCSSPTVKGRSKVERFFLDSDQRRYYVPCPHCNHMQTLKMPNLKYEKNKEGNVDEVYYLCEECGVLIEEHHKTWMLENGEWRPDNPGHDPEKVGFHISSLYSPVGWFSWLEIATKWDLAQGNRDLLQVFVNTILGETWEERGEAPGWEMLYRQRELYKIGTVPTGGLFLTAGADVQKDRIEIEVVAWGRNRQSWSVSYDVIPGDTSTDAPFAELDKFLYRTFPHASGVNMQIMRLGVDSGYNTQMVYGYCRNYVDTLRVMATKGQESLQTALGAPKAVELSVGGKRMPRALKLWLIGTSMLKTELYRALRQQSPLKAGDDFPYGFCHFPEYGEDYFKMLTAEELKPVQNPRTKFIKHEWVKKQDRNEALDCRVIARAMASSLGYDRMTDAQFDSLEKQFDKQIEKAKAKTNAVPAQPVVTVNAGTAARQRGIRNRGLN